MNKLMLTSVAAGSVILAFSASAATRTWTGAVSDVWEEDGNWTDGDGAAGVPQEGDSVIIGSSAADVSVLLSSSTPKLASLQVGNLYNVYKAANLTVVGWNTCIQADTVILGGKAYVTCAGPSATMEEMSRVWIKCVDLTLKKENSTGQSGSINVTGKGFATAGKGATGYGIGPGGAHLYGSASHGGYGALAVMQMNSNFGTNDSDYFPVALPYDEASAPVLPGSSGPSNLYGANGAGGGVVRIEATGRVTVSSASILADGLSATNYDTFNSDNTCHDGAGAGGSIYITCKTFAGQSGTLRAEGGGGDNPNATQPSPCGGGGRIAIVYDTAEQTSSLVSGMKYSAGVKCNIWRCTQAEYAAHGNVWYKHTLPLASNDIYKAEADIGTLWFSDTKLLVSSLGTGISGQICNLPTSLTLDSLDLTSGHVRFPADGFVLNITGDLNVSGASSRLELGGAYATNLFWRSKAVLRGSAATHLNVGGDMTIASGARVDIRGAATDDTHPIGAYVKVDGTLSVADGGFLMPHSDAVTGGSPRFDVGAFEVAAGGVVSATARGYSGGSAQKGKLGEKGFGPGAGYVGASQFGASYGGLGGYCGVRGITNDYGVAVHPVFPGSGGTTYQGPNYGGNGGGLVWVVASGDITVDGQILADGEPGRCGNGYAGATSGSGGGICLECQNFRGASTGVLSAKGGDGYNNYAGSGAGGGGRIAVLVGEPYVEGISRSRLHVQSTPFTPETGAAFAGNCFVSGGVNAYVQTTLPADAANGGPGTLNYVNITPALGLILLLK